MKKLPMPRIGSDRETPSDVPTPSCESITRASGPHSTMAKQQVERLFNLLPPQDVLAPEEFLAASVSLFARYPPEVMTRAAFEIPTRSDRPTLKLMKTVLEEIYAPIEREIERQRAANSHSNGLPLPRPQRTPAQQARIDQLVASVRKQFGISPR